MDLYHRSVLVNEVLEYLQVAKNKIYIDATLGGGGHTFKILEHGGKVLGIDADEEAVQYVENTVKNQKPEIKLGEDLLLARGNFREIEVLAHGNGLRHVSGILFDLGVSSHHLDTKERGFSFQKNGPLDMRMDQRLAVSAKDLINALTKGELYELFSRLGEERFAKTISDNIVRSRRIIPIETTEQLRNVIEEVVHYRSTDIHPATRVFQSLRIAVNDELRTIEEALPKALSILEEKGRIVVISFHSLEDRIVKHFFKDQEQKGKGTILTKKPIIAGEEEIFVNFRSRSAKLRAFEKI